MKKVWIPEQYVKEGEKPVLKARQPLSLSLSL